MGLGLLRGCLGGFTSLARFVDRGGGLALEGVEQAAVDEGHRAARSHRVLVQLLLEVVAVVRVQVAAQVAEGAVKDRAAVGEQAARAVRL